MNRLTVTPLRRIGAWVMCLMLIVMQFALPISAMATADLSGLPMVTLFYSVAEGSQQPLSVAPSLNGEAPVYWATLPQEAFQFPILLQITPPAGGTYAYTPEPGTPIISGDALDFSSASTMILVYEDGAQIDGYPLYVSSSVMPVPTQVTAMVPVVYQVVGQAPFYTEEVLCTHNMDNVISVKMDQAQGYTLISEGSVYVSVDEAGNAYPSPVSFLFEEQKPTEVKNGTVVVHYLDENGAEITQETQTLEPGTHNVSYRFIPDGYTPNLESAASVQVEVDEQGVTDPEHVYLHFKKEQGQEPPTEEEEEPPVVQESEPPVVEEEPPVVEEEPPVVEEEPPVVEEEPPVVEEEPPVVEEEPAEDEPSELTPVGRYAQTATVVNFRTGPGKTNTKAFADVKSSTYIWVVGTVTVGSETWAKIIYNGTECYVAVDLGDGKTYINILSQEDSDAYNHAQSTPIPGTETPAPTSVNVPVSYVDANNPGNVLDTQNVSCATNADSVIVATLSNLAGYTVVGDDRVTVSVSESGKATPATVVFTVQKVAVLGSFTVRHITADNQDIIPPQTTEQAEGTYNITPSGAGVPEGYVLTSAGSVSVTIDASGKATPEVVTFTYEKPAIIGTVNVFYKNTMDATIAAAEERTLAEGDNAISPNASLVPEGYTLRAGDPASVNVILRADGTVNPQSVTFVYEQDEQETPAAEKATVVVSYVDDIGQPLATQTIEYDKAGTYTIAADASLVPSEYVLNESTSRSVEVTVNDQLIATPDSVSFQCKKPAQSAKVPVNYVLKADNTVLATETLEFAPGTNPKVVPNAGIVPAGYSLAEGSTLYVDILVDAQGVATPNAVTFYYKKTEADQYEGYGLTTAKVALRLEGSMADSAIISTLEQDTLLYLKRQFDSNSVRWSEVQQVLGTNLGSGFVQDDQIRHITPAEAQAIIDRYNANNATPTPKPWVPPAQVTGYYITIMNSVPVRTTADSYANVHSWLSFGTAVYVSGQLFPNQETWHISTYDGYTGYIRADQVRKMTAQEEQIYIDSLTTPIDTNIVAPTPDPYAKSSYGYVTSNNVNFRQTPNGNKIKTVNKYALALIYGSQVVNGKTWYNVNQGGTTGWISGDFLHVMTLTEFNSFLYSNEYYQGLTNSGSTNGSTTGNTGSTSSGTSNSTGSSTTGSISSVEDWNVGVWQSAGSGTGVNASYAPFDPYATPAPSIDPDATASVEPTGTFVIGTMIPINYEEDSMETGSSPWGLIAAGVILVGGGGGVYAYALSQNAKRKAAARAAAASRKAGQPLAGAAAAAGAKQGTQSPYARRAVAAPPAAGTKQNPNAMGTQNANLHPTAGAGTKPNPFAPTGAASNAQGIFSAPLAGTQQNADNPYARPAGQSAESATSPTTPQTGASSQPASNPYVQPLGKTPAVPADAAAPGTARRTSRAQRYQSTEGDDGKA